MIPLSSNHLSVDDQIDAVVSHLKHDPLLSTAYRQFREEFPEYDRLKWEGSWVATVKSDVDSEYMSWVADWIENNTPIYWEEGEPWLPEADDEEE
jgi:predicted dithiol-disulfide oxidoreductase (DUF899 family)